jgi:hypothetical protein
MFCKKPLCTNNETMYSSLNVKVFLLRDYPALTAANPSEEGYELRQGARGPQDYFPLIPAYHTIWIRFKPVLEGKVSLVFSYLALFLLNPYLLGLLISL